MAKIGRDSDWIGFVSRHSGIVFAGYPLGDEISLTRSNDRVKKEWRNVFGCRSEMKWGFKRHQVS